MANKKNFFENPEDHSKVKLVVLEEFFPQWIYKVFYNNYNKNNERLIVFDGFAGPGEYDNGIKGSPLICLENIFRTYGRRKK